MRSIVLGVGISLDGYIARLDGSVDFLFMPKGYSMAPFVKTIDSAIMGRKTYEAGKKMGGGFSGWGMEFFVLTRTLPPGEREGVTFTSESPAAIVGKLRKKRGKRVWLMGGGETARAFLQADLVDELHLGVVPVLLGEGLPLFPPGFPQRNFALVKNKTYAQGLIALEYKRAAAKPAKPRKAAKRKA
jgi:dihydrofolate reductase